MRAAMTMAELNRRFFRPGIPILDFDIAPILITEQGKVYSVGSKFAREHRSRIAAERFWKRQGFRIFVLTERPAVAAS